MKRIAQFSSYGAVVALALVTLVLFVYGGLLANGQKITLISKAYADVPYLQSGYFGNYSQANYAYTQAAYVYIQSSYYTQSSYYGQGSYGDGGGGGGNGDYINQCDNGQEGFTEVGGRIYHNGNPTNLRSGGGTSGGK